MWPLNSFRTRPDLRPWTLTTPSKEPLRTCPPHRENLTVVTPSEWAPWIVLMHCPLRYLHTLMAPCWSPEQMSSPSLLKATHRIGHEWSMNLSCAW